MRKMRVFIVVLTESREKKKKKGNSSLFFFLLLVAGADKLPYSFLRIYVILPIIIPFSPKCAIF